MFNQTVATSQEYNLYGTILYTSVNKSSKSVNKIGADIKKHTQKT